MLNLDDFKKAHKSISPYINYTPLIHSLELSKNLEFYLKKYQKKKYKYLFHGDDYQVLFTAPINKIYLIKTK